MFREIAQIILAIQLSTSHLLPVRAQSFAQVMQKDAVKIGIDPFLFVAIAAHESHFNELAISKDGEDYGLLQIRAKYIKYNPNWLLTGENNINVGSYLITKDIEYCQKILHREPTTQEWLSVFQGSPSAYKCKPTKMTKQFEDYAVCLDNNIVNNLPQDCKVIYNN